MVFSVSLFPGVSFVLSLDPLEHVFAEPVVRFR